MKEGDIELLKLIAEHEGSIDFNRPGAELGWGWRDVRVQPAVLTRLYLEGYLDNTFKSNKDCRYLLSDLGKRVIEVGQLPSEREVTRPQQIEIPDDLFDVIEGYEDIKDLVRTVIRSEKAVHLLFTGVPASAKTMFLMELSRLGAPYVLGSQASRAGIAEVLFDTEPQVLLIDELDRIGAKDISVLLSLTATGIVSETKHGKQRQVTLGTKVFAACNRLNLAPELLSRFMVLEFHPYSLDDFLKVATNVLVKQEGTDAELATYIARRVWQSSRRFPDPRQAVRVARLASTKAEVDRLFSLMVKYSRAGWEGQLS